MEGWLSKKLQYDGSLHAYTFVWTFISYFQLQLQAVWFWLVAEFQPVTFADISCQHIGYHCTSEFLYKNGYELMTRTSVYNDPALAPHPHVSLGQVGKRDVK